MKHAMIHHVIHLMNIISRAKLHDKLNAQFFLKIMGVKGFHYYRRRVYLRRS